MKIEGRFLDDVKTEKGLAFFKDIYETTPEQMMEDYDTNRVTFITHNEYKYVAFLEYDGTVNHLFKLEDENDSIIVHAQDGLEECGVFNTDGIAFMYVNSAFNGEQKLFSIENSPYDLSNEDIEELSMQEDFTIEALLASVGEDATLQNTKFVAQL